jgi:hypothetical protein
MINYPIWYYAPARFQWLDQAHHQLRLSTIFRRKFMKRLCHFCATTVLTISVALSAFAGNINCGAVAPPPEQPASVMGDIPNGATATDETASAEIVFIDPATGLALDILRSLLSLF